MRADGVGHSAVRWAGASLVLSSVLLTTSVAGSRTASALPPVVAGVTAAAVSVPVAPPDPGYRLTDLPPTTFTCAGGCVDARAQGVVGDGVTNAAPALQRVLNGAPAAGTPVVYLPAGTYLLSSTVTLPAGVTLRGAGIVPGADTVLLLDWSHRDQLSYVLRPQDPAATLPVTVRDLTVDGGRRVCANGTNDPTLCPGDHDGGISAGNNWTITRDRFVGINGFKVWVGGVRNVEVSAGHFDNLAPGATSGGMDNIGGGAGASQIRLLGNEVDASAAGNSVDLTRASQVVVSGYRVWATTDPHSMFLEGVTGSQVTGNVLRGGGGITLQSNGNYASAVRYGVTNPRNDVVSGNVLVRPGFNGVQVLYRGLVGDGRAAADAVSPPAAPPFLLAGGANTIRGNTVFSPAKAGIVLAGSDDRYKNAPDTIDANVVLDVGQDGETAFNDGLGLDELGGVVDLIGVGDHITATTVIDDQSTPTTPYGVVLGRYEFGNRLRTTARATVVTGTVVSGVPGGAVRRSVPVVTAVSRATVSTRGGTAVTLLGSGFLRRDQLTVVVGTTVLTPTVVSDGVLTFSSPVLDAGPAAVQVNTPYGSSAAPVAGLDGTTGTLSLPVTLQAVVPVDVVSAAGLSVDRTGGTLRVATGTGLGTASVFAAHAVTATVTVAGGVPRLATVRYVDATDLDLTLPPGPIGQATIQLTRDGVAGRPATVTYSAVLTARAGSMGRAGTATTSAVRAEGVGFEPTMGVTP